MVTGLSVIIVSIGGYREKACASDTQKGMGEQGAGKERKALLPLLLASCRSLTDCFVRHS